MHEGKSHGPGSEDDANLASLIADAPELWQLVDQFVHSLPVQMKLLQEALRKGSLEQLRKSASQLQAASAQHGYGELAGRFEEFQEAIERAVVEDLAACIDDLTATVLRIRENLEKNSC